jgi:hypothetical protein
VSCSWAHGAFDVLHPAPGSRLAGCHQDGWDRAAASSSDQQQREPPPPQQPTTQQQAPASPSDESTGASQAMMEQ